jgi:hypothetical protein
VTRASEIEVAKTLCELSQYMSLNEATEEIRNNEPQCAAYIAKVASYVEHFSGHLGAPVQAWALNLCQPWPI